MDQITLNYYKPRTQNKFQSQKPQQNKHYCAVCKLEIPGHRASVIFHEQSKVHIQKKQEAIDRSYSKAKTGGAVQSSQTTTPLLKELHRIEEAAASKYNQSDVNGFRYKKLVKEQTVAKSLENFDVDLGYKKPKRFAGEGDTFTADDVRNEPVWSSHFDEESGMVYYYSRLTHQSQWDKPEGFDGYEIMAGQGALTKKKDDEYYRTFQQFTQVTELEHEDKPVVKGEGVVGGWEEVAEEDDYFKTHSISKLDEEQRKELENKEEQSKAKTLEEIILENLEDSEESEKETATVEQVFQEPQPRLIGKRKAQRPNLTEGEREKEKFKELRQEVEKGGDSWQKETYSKQNNQTKAVFKKRQVKGEFKQRKEDYEDLKD